jgi:hypothetical protein
MRQCSASLQAAIVGAHLMDRKHFSLAKQRSTARYLSASAFSLVKSFSTSSGGCLPK